MTTHRIQISGPSVRGTRVSGALLRDLLAELLDSAQQALRLRVEGRSRAQGKLPGWLEKAANFDLIDIEAGSSVLVLEAPAVAEAAPERFAQLQFFAPFDPNLTCIELLQETLCDALSERNDSDLYDDGLVATLEGFERVMRHGVDSISFMSDAAPRIDANGLRALHRLRDAIPRDQAVLVEGKLDELRHSDRFFTLILESGERIRGIATEEVDLDRLGELWAKPVRVQGIAKFRPSRALLRVDAEWIEATDGGPSPWSKMPRPFSSPGEVQVPSRPQGPRSGISAIFGKWPGDETEAELIEALERMS